MPSLQPRTQMVEQQVRTWDVLDERVLGVLYDVDRAGFVPESHRALAYADAELPLAHGQHMLTAALVGRLLQALAIERTERVLEIGTGTGYVTACLAALARSVHSLEFYPDLADAARRNLATLTATNTKVVTADAFQPGAVSGRFDVIAVTGSLPLYTPLFERQLEVGGRLFVVVGQAPVMEARLVRRMAEDAFVTQSLFETCIDPLVNAPLPSAFVF